MNKEHNKTTEKPTEQTAELIPYFTPEREKELTAINGRVLAEVFNPDKIVTLKDAEKLINTSLAFSNRLNLASYKAIERVHDLELWRNQSYIGKKGLEYNYVSFEEWCKLTYNIGKTSVYDYLKVARFILPDGSGSILYHDTAKDFTFTHLVKFCNNKSLYDEVEKTAEDKNGKEKTIKVKEMKTIQAVERVTKENGAPAYGEHGEKLFKPLTNEDGEPVIISLLEYLAIIGEISPEMSVKVCDEKITRYCNSLDITDEETTEETNEETTEETNEETIEETNEETIEETTDIFIPYELYIHICTILSKYKEKELLERLKKVVMQ